MSRIGSPLAALFALTFVFGCSSDDSDDGVTFTADIHPLFLAKCGGSACHNGDQAPTLPGHAAEDVMEAYEASQAMSFLGVPVYERILVRVTDEMAMMPPNFANPPCMGEIGTPGCLTQAEVDQIEAWIDAGTPL